VPFPVPRKQPWHELLQAMGGGASSQQNEVVIKDVMSPPPQENGLKPLTSEKSVTAIKKGGNSRQSHWTEKKDKTGWQDLNEVPAGYNGLKQSESFGRQASGGITSMIKKQTGDHFDIIVLGGGPVGVKAALEAASRGLRVGLIEPKAKLTGAPTGAHSKCFREAAMNGAKTFEEVKQVVAVAKEKTMGAASRQLRASHVQILKGLGYILAKDQVRFLPAEGVPRTLTFEVLIIATGSKSNRIPNIPYELEGVYDSDTIRNINYIPEKLVVQGAGIIGLEYALIFSKLGSKQVTVIEAFDKVVPMLDSALQEACKRTMKDNGISFLLKTPIRGVVRGKQSTPTSPLLRVDIGDRIFECDCLLSACGRLGKVEDLGLNILEKEGLKFGRGKTIQVDENGWTGVGRIYAVGDVAGSSLATVGQALAVRAVRSTFGTGHMSSEKIKSVKPSGVWTIPEIAWAGITEEDAVKEGLPYGTAIVDYHQTVRGCVTQEEGFLKLVYDKENGKVLGVHIFGETSTDLVNYGAEVVNDGETIFEVLQFVFPAVTYHELYHLAAHQAKIKFMYKGTENVMIATAWARVQAQFNHSLKETDQQMDKDRAIKKAFNYFDTDGSGEITVKQLQTALGSLGINLSEDDCAEMVVEATGGEDGGPMVINYEEFTQMLKR